MCINLSSLYIVSSSTLHPNSSLLLGKCVNLRIQLCRLTYHWLSRSCLYTTSLSASGCASNQAGCKASVKIWKRVAPLRVKAAFA